GILVRYFKTDIIDNYIRVTIGSDKEMDIFFRKNKRYNKKLNILTIYIRV
ncbi:histidinol-phosphate aminotransferase, partial [Brachyspira hampsonii 30599]